MCVFLIFTVGGKRFLIETRSGETQKKKTLNLNKKLFLPEKNRHRRIIIINTLVFSVQIFAATGKLFLCERYTTPPSPNPTRIGSSRDRNDRTALVVPP